MTNARFMTTAIGARSQQHQGVVQILCVVCLALLPLQAASAQPIAPPPTHALSMSSSLWVGCLPPCYCSTIFLGSVGGTFQVQLVSTVGEVEHYTLTSLQTAIPQSSGAVIDLTGSGTLTRNVVTEAIDMTLDVLLSGQATTFTSTAYDPTVSFPELAVDLASDTTCSATFFTFVATPITEPVLRGDCNQDSLVDLADAVRVLTYLFPIDIDGDGATDSFPVACVDACDGNDDGSLNVSDAVRILNALFGTPTQPLPGPVGGGCDVDATPDDLGCASSSC
ncbi:MAG: hypothetical protein AAF581_10015 [Planctomycetota bacterium]